MLDVADIRPSLLNLLIVTLMAIVGIAFLRYLTALAPDMWPGFTTLIGAI
jgi:hypothetical protein